MCRRKLSTALPSKKTRSSSLPSRAQLLTHSRCTASATATSSSQGLSPPGTQANQPSWKRRALTISLGIRGVRGARHEGRSLRGEWPAPQIRGSGIQRLGPRRRFGQQQLRGADAAFEKAAFAVAQVELPQPVELLVVAELFQAVA